MSGDNGRGYSTGAHGIGDNINGDPAGLDVGGGASDGSRWSSENGPWGGGSGSDIHWSSGSGHGNGGGNGNSGGSSETGGNLSVVATPAAFGLPTLSTPGAGGLAVSISVGALLAAIADIMAALEGPFKLDLWGAALYGVLPPQITKDDPNVMSKIVMSLPADDVTESPVSSLPLDKTAANVNVRTVDDVKNERQNISVVSGVPMGVPVVDTKPARRPGAFTISIPDVPVLNTPVSNSTPAIRMLSPGIVNNTDKNVRPAGFTQGGDIRDAVIRFPKDGGRNAIYVSVSDVLSPDQVKQRQDEENRRQQGWDAMHPVETTERSYERARAELNQMSEDVARNQERQAKVVRVYNLRKSELDAANKAFADVIVEIKQFDRFTHGPMAGDHRVWQMIRFRAQRVQAGVNNKQAAFDAAAKEESDADVALSTAQECRRQKENKEKDARGKLDEGSRRDKPEKATGKGRPAGSKWLDDVGKDSGTPIPDRIADKLYDKELKNFDGLWKKFWGEVSKGPDPSKQLKGGNKANIRKGETPFAGKKSQVSGRERFELHHDKPISQDGGVYGMNNIGVTTPKRYIDIHRGR